MKAVFRLRKRKSTDYGEFIVHVEVDGSESLDRRYHTNDWPDAVATLRAMIDDDIRHHNSSRGFIVTVETKR